MVLKRDYIFVGEDDLRQVAADMGPELSAETESGPREAEHSTTQHNI